MNGLSSEPVAPTEPAKDLHGQDVLGEDVSSEDFQTEDAHAILLVVAPADAEERLDKFLAKHLGETYSRERIQALIKGGNIHKEGQVWNKPSFSVKVGQVIEVHAPELQPLEMPAWDVPLDVVFEDEHLLVINKPRAMLTHPTGLQQPNTLVNAVLHHCKGQLSGINGVERPGIVHRLDRDTEGLIVVAKSDQAHHGLAEQLLHKTMTRRYNAIVQGLVQDLNGTVRIGIGRHSQQRNKMQADWTGKPAVTHYQVKETLNDKFTWVQCQLETGRTHQIRVHMAYIGHPLVGDPLYGTGLALQWKELMPEAGQALQAYALRFIHPITREAKHFELPPSEHLLKVWDALTHRL
jgi:23S rRNA pseudouridine1911/1915/1917 synthase